MENRFWIHPVCLLCIGGFNHISHRAFFNHPKKKMVEFLERPVCERRHSGAVHGGGSGGGRGEAAGTRATSSARNNFHSHTVAKHSIR